ITLDTSSSKRLTPSCNAGVTTATFSTVDRRLKTSTSSGLGTRATVQPVCAEESGENIKETSKFQKHRGSRASNECGDISLFIRHLKFCSSEGRLSSAQHA